MSTLDRCKWAAHLGVAAEAETPKLQLRTGQSGDRTKNQGSEGPTVTKVRDRRTHMTGPISILAE